MTGWLGKGFINHPVQPHSHSLARVGAQGKIPLRLFILGLLTERTGSRRNQPPQESNFQKTGWAWLPGCWVQRVWFVALGSGISEGGAITSDLGLSAGTSLNGATGKVTLGGGQSPSAQ